MKYLFEQHYELKIEMHVAYFADIFAHLNHLNLQLQCSGNVRLEGSANVFVVEDKDRTFLFKIHLCIDNNQVDNYSVFPTLGNIFNDKQYKCVTEDVQDTILTTPINP